MIPRSSGVLLHITSLPSAHGIGDLGPEAYRFVDWLAAAGQQVWQILPLGPTGYGNSPYSAGSAFAGNSDLISLDRLVEDGLLVADQLRHALPQDHVDYDNVHKFKQYALHLAFERFQPSAEYQAFLGRAAYWLDDYVRVTAGSDAQEAAFLCFEQFEFDRQWAALRQYGNERHVLIVGDVPIFVADGSADVRAHPELFYLDTAGKPTKVAGVPPDLFSETGQRWGNPLYNWPAMAERGFDWWRDRLRRTMEFVDVVRIDHFRGFAAYWAVPASEPTAVNGEWEQAPGHELFRTLSREMGALPIVVEDLGLITSDVIELRDDFGFPGMKVLQFAFDGHADNPYLPHAYPHECIVYTGTHDNDTTRGWYDNQPEETKDIVRRYLARDLHEPAWDLMRLASASVAQAAIFPVQDLLSLGNEARLNFPGTPDGNWAWRLAPGALTNDLAGRLHDLTALYGRLPQSPREPEVVDGYPFGVAAINSGL
ncbi:MAG: 4-alpha-glucanotransferase [Chloroflexi bacterium]|nr:4-alpha-glucanotransferase [Chloroflexota bacterium]